MSVKKEKIATKFRNAAATALTIWSFLNLTPPEVFAQGPIKFIKGDDCRITATTPVVIEGNVHYPFVNESGERGDVVINNTAGSSVTKPSLVSDEVIAPLIKAHNDCKNTSVDPTPIDLDFFFQAYGAKSPQEKILTICAASGITLAILGRVLRALGNDHIRQGVVNHQHAIELSTYGTPPKNTIAMKAAETGQAWALLGTVLTFLGLLGSPVLSGVTGSLPEPAFIPPIDAHFLESPVGKRLLISAILALILSFPTIHDFAKIWPTPHKIST